MRLHSDLFTARVKKEIGSAVWLLCWLVVERGREGGWTYKMLSSATGHNARTMERWTRRLRRAGYIETHGTQQLDIKLTLTPKGAAYGQETQSMRSQRNQAAEAGLTIRHARADGPIREITRTPRK